MILIIGGYAQGKRAYAVNNYNIPETAIWDGKVMETDALSDVPDGKMSEAEGLPKVFSARGVPEADGICFDHFNSWARRRFEAGSDAWEQVLALDRHLKKKGGKLIILSTEIGNGIVPIDAGDRGFREWMGRLQVQIAGEAEEVIRICCGIPQILK